MQRNSYRNSTYSQNKLSFHRQQSRDLSCFIHQNSGQTTSLHISRKLSRQIDSKMETAQCINDIIKKSHKKINNALNKSRFQQSSHTLKKGNCREDSEKFCLKKLQDKIAKLKNRIFPEQKQQKKVENKLKQIMYINDEVNRRQKAQFDNSRISPFRKEKEQENEQIIFGNNKIINKYWNDLQKQSKLTKQVLLKIKENRIKLLINKNVENQRDIEQIYAAKQNFSKSIFRGPSDLRKTQDTNQKSTSSLNTSIRKMNKTGQNSPIKFLRSSTGDDKEQFQSYRDALSRQIVENSMMDYFKHKEEKKIFLKQLNKQLIEGEDVCKIYSFIKGGYHLDPSDIQGQFLSLQRFNEAKQSFSTLNELYKQTKNDSFFNEGFTLNEISSKLLDRSFRSLVYINQLNGKIAPTQLLKLMKKSKIVK